MVRTAMGLFLAAPLLFGSITNYTSYAEWQAAIDAKPGAFVQVESFAGGTLHVPGLTITSQSGMGGAIGTGSLQIGDASVSDCVGKGGCPAGNYDTTLISYSTDAQLYGLFFDSIEVGNGDATSEPLEFWLSLPSQGTNALATLAGAPITFDGRVTGYQPLAAGAWGFVSDVPFNDITLAEDGPAVRYQAAGNWYFGDPTTATPEPLSLALCGLPLCLFALWRKRKAVLVQR